MKLSTIQSVNVPNFFTLLRILLVIPMGLYAEVEHSILLGTLFLIAGITDYVDGIYARKYNQKTMIGSVMDPIADKILLIAGLVILFKIGTISLMLAVIFIILEFTIAGLREFMARLGKVGLVLPNFISDRKIDFQFAGVTLLFYGFTTIGMYVLYVGLLLTVMSVVSKFKEARAYL